MIGVINYGVGNLGSIINMLRVIGAKANVVSSPEELSQSDKLILPGVGSFDTGMNSLIKAGLVPYILEQAIDKEKPILGICLGMQMLGRRSDEGVQKGLGLIPFESRKFNLKGSRLKIPHMGWDIVSIERDCPLTHGIEAGSRYYFVHSYHAVCDSKDNVLMRCDYGYQFDAAVVKKNIYGVQFHPEKSHNFGLHLLKNFAEDC